MATAAWSITVYMVPFALFMLVSGTLAVQSTPANRGGATSVTLAAQFTGNAGVPLLCPLYATNPPAATGVAAAVGFAAIAIVTLTGRERG